MSHFFTSCLSCSGNGGVIGNKWGFKAVKGMAICGKIVSRHCDDSQKVVLASGDVMNWRRLERNLKILLRSLSISVLMMAGNWAVVSVMMTLASSGIVMAMTGRGEAGEGAGGAVVKN